MHHRPGRDHGRRADPVRVVRGLPAGVPRPPCDGLGYSRSPGLQRAGCPVPVMANRCKAGQDSPGPA